MFKSEMLLLFKYINCKMKNIDSKVNEMDLMLCNWTFSGFTLSSLDLFVRAHEKQYVSSNNLWAIDNLIVHIH